MSKTNEPRTLGEQAAEKIEECRTCSKCGVEKRIEAFSPIWDRPGNLRRRVCRQCVAFARLKHYDPVKTKEKRLRRLESPEVRDAENSRCKARQQAHREQTRAKSMLHRKLKQGSIVKPSSCQDCFDSESPIEAHHPDYSKPLEVEWLCISCHRRKHLGLKPKRLHQNVK